MKKNCIIKIWLLVLIIGFSFSKLFAQEPPENVKMAIQEVEKMLFSNDEKVLTDFVNKVWVSVDQSDKNKLLHKLKSIQHEVKGLNEGIGVEAEPHGFRFILMGKGKEKQLKVIMESEGISDIQLLEVEETVPLTRESLEETFKKLEDKGFSGVIYIKLDGKDVLKRGFGWANKELEIKNSVNTVFGTGSRPIDYTIAAILLLDQHGKISLDDTIDKYFKNVPADKKSITIRHLMSGQSGLIDFFHTKDDWDPDLAWVDRETAEKRLLNSKLLFVPGSDQKHSHGAFGLLAALIERVSGMKYYSFLRKYFFDPAGMEHTGEYGEIRNLGIKDFAAGGGPNFVGLPNIPPNWGPTSWLIKGSGGMYSNLNDLLKFYEYLRSGEILDKKHAKHFNQPSANLDGSDRGFELFNYYHPSGNEVFLFINNVADRNELSQLFRSLERFAQPD